jgi:hypothetical protein
MHRRLVVLAMLTLAACPRRPAHRLHTYERRMCTCGDMACVRAAKEDFVRAGGMPEDLDDDMKELARSAAECTANLEEVLYGGPMCDRDP